MFDMGIRNFELTRAVAWRLPSGSVTREATFFVCADDTGVILLRLVRVQACGCSFGRRDALIFEQPVAEWEAAAEASLQAVPDA